jgi:hypothetical protein
MITLRTTQEEDMITLRTTQEDREKGVPCHEQQCPIARAIRRVVGVEDVWVDYGAVRIGERYYSLNDAAEEFITEFDSSNGNVKKDVYIILIPK